MNVQVETLWTNQLRFVDISDERYHSDWRIGIHIQLGEAVVLVVLQKSMQLLSKNTTR